MALCERVASAAPRGALRGDPGPLMASSARGRPAGGGYSVTSARGAEVARATTSLPPHQREGVDGLATAAS
ncbi:unnamed protein product [Lampetra planeri]